MNKNTMRKWFLLLLVVVLLIPAAVSAQKPVESVTVEPNDGVTSSVIDGGSLQLIARVMPLTASNRSVVWSVACEDPSECEGLADVPAKVTANKTGAVLKTHDVSKMVNVVVTATAVDGSGVSGSYTVTLYPKAVQLMVLDSDTVITLISEYGDPYQFHANFLNNAKAPIIKDLLDASDRTVQLGAYIVSSTDVDPTKNVKWTTSNKKIAEVDSTGLVTFYRAGTVKITAQTTDGSKLKTTATVTAKILVHDIDIYSKTGSTTVGAGKKLQLVASVIPSNATNKKVTWYSMDRHIATVSSSGKVTGGAVKEPQQVEICAASTDVDWRNQPIASSCFEITVSPAVTKIDIQDSNGYTVTGKTIKFDVSDSGTELGIVTTPALSMSEVAWTTSNKKIATVDDEGKVTFTGGTGTVTITAKAIDGSGKKASVKIRILAQVQDISISATKTLVRSGQKVNLTAVLNPTNATIKKLLWTSSNTDAFKLSGTSLKVSATAKNVVEQMCSDVIAYATDDSGVASNTEQVCVYPTVKRIIVLDPDSNEDMSGRVIKLEVGDTLVIAARSYPDDAPQAFRVTNSNAKAVSLDVSKTDILNHQGGDTVTITGEKKGQTAVITVKAYDDVAGQALGQTAKITVKVVAPSSSSATVSGPASALAGESLSLSAKVYPEDAEASEIFWYSSDESVATVDASGNVTIAEDAADAAVVTITGLVNDGSGVFATHEITVVNPKAAEVLEVEAVSEEAEETVIEAESEAEEITVEIESYVVEEQPADETEESDEDAEAVDAAGNEDTDATDEVTTESAEAETAVQTMEAEETVTDEPQPESEAVEDAASVVESIEVDVENDTVTLTVGETLTIEPEKLTVLPADASWDALSFEIETEWLAALESDDLADIREYGLKIRALAVGETKLTISAGEVEKEVRIIIEALQVVEEVVVEPEAVVAEETVIEQPAETVAEEVIVEAEPAAEAVDPEPEAEEPAVEETAEEADLLPESEPEAAAEPVEEDSAE